MPQVDLGRPATYDDLLRAPGHLVAEIVDRELWTSPRPAPRQAHAQSIVGAVLVTSFGAGGQGPGGWRILFEPELHLQQDVLVPDVAGWKRERMPALPEKAWFDVPPDWICEIVSPSTALLDRTRKMRIYAHERVGHAWLIDPLARTLEVLRLSADRWTVPATYGGAARVRAEPFDQVEVALPLLWDEPV